MDFRFEKKKSYSDEEMEKKTKTFVFELHAQEVLLVFSLKTKMNYNRSIYLLNFILFLTFDR